MKAKTIPYFLVGLILVVTGVGSIFYLAFNVLLQLGVAMGSWTAFGVFLLYLFTSVPAFEGAGAWIARGLTKIKLGKKSAVALKIEHELNTAREEISSQTKGLIPYPAKVEWIEKASYLDTEEEKVIIRMREHKDNPRNVAFAVIDYISEGMIPFSRIYIEKPIQTAIDATMIREILLEKYESAVDYYLTHVLNKRLSEKDVRYYLEVINNIHKRGMMIRILLEEFKELGLRMYPMTDEDALKETKEYVEHLYLLATREIGEIGKSDPFLGKHIKVAYLLIADPKKIREIGDAPYIEYAYHRIKDGAEAIYLLSRGGKNKPATRLAEKIAKSCNMKIANKSEYEDLVGDEVMSALCIELRKN